MARLAALALIAGLAAIGQPGASRAQDADASELLVRLNRLEGQVRRMSGEIEQLQYENRQVKEAARKFQEDVEFRFSERSGARPGPATTGATPSGAAQPAAPRPQRRSDAFDPDENPAAAGAPRPLGQTTPSPTDGTVRRQRADSAFTEGGEPPRTASAPLDLGAAARGTTTPRMPAATPAGAASVAGLNPAAASANPPSAGTAGSEANEARAEYDAAHELVSQKLYDQAEPALRRFISAHPKDRLAADATYWLGESFLQRGKHREAAEQFLKVSTDYTRSAKAPEAFLKLGTSLAALGAKDQACATFAELERKYPTASAGVKQGVAREQKRSRCT